MTLKVFLITSEWPTKEHPEWGIFIVDQVESLRSLGVQIDVFPFRGGKSLVKYIAAWIKAKIQSTRNDYDLVHAHFGQSGLLALPKTMPLLVTYHGSDLQGYRRPDGRFSLGTKPLQLVSRFVALRADLSIVVSEHLKQYLPEVVDGVTIPCGVDFNVFRPMRREKAIEYLGLDKKKQYVLFPANPNRIVKRFYLAQEVIGIVRKSFEDVELLSLTNVAHTDVPYYINASHSVLLTSYQEGSPTVVKEALACDTPVFSVDVGDVREHLEGIMGCKICAPVAEELAGAVVEGLKNYDKIDSREKVRYLDIDVVANNIFEHYLELSNNGNI